MASRSGPKRSLRPPAYSIRTQCDWPRPTAATFLSSPPRGMTPAPSNTRSSVRSSPMQAVPQAAASRCRSAAIPQSSRTSRSSPTAPLPWSIRNRRWTTPRRTIRASCFSATPLMAARWAGRSSSIPMLRRTSSRRGSQRLTAAAMLSPGEARPAMTARASSGGSTHRSSTASAMPWASSSSSMKPSTAASMSRMSPVSKVAGLPSPTVMTIAPTAAAQAFSCSSIPRMAPAWTIRSR